MSDMPPPLEMPCGAPGYLLADDRPQHLRGWAQEVARLESQLVELRAKVRELELQMLGFFPRVVGLQFSGPTKGSEAQAGEMA